MEPWEAYLPNTSTEEFQRMKSEYEGWFLENIQESTPLYDFAIREIENHLFLLGGESEEDIRIHDGEDLHYALGRPAIIFQLGMKRDPVDVVGILKCIQYWAYEHCKGVKYGVRPFLSEIFKFDQDEVILGKRYNKPEDYENLAAEKLYREDE